MTLPIKKTFKSLDENRWTKHHLGKTRRGLRALVVNLASKIPTRRKAEQIFHAQLFFGMSIPSGHAISLLEWSNCIDNHISPRFEGFNIADSMGFWQGQPERAKIVTIVLKEPHIPEVEAIASDYATLFHQDSVMLIIRPVAKWEFVPSD
ncbi:hypothetical protein VII00023_22114 [Vibrio ichthyoenteri ATCC 700023]|uniref:DUF190 domain-containing protein n=1 Tax=Vibrio ichthyoenteri ATCC 700023 TaxID=870968 RepID=F9S738_9VIBR|nr:DUF3574 domain-containing protein [Vibrio ichthyoenteri]EGU32018.1 hypothetical protein VII00023_22114 [Vibrio ichthyoenteri ATCC 700023]